MKDNVPFIHTVSNILGVVDSTGPKVDCNLNLNPKCFSRSLHVESEIRALYRSRVLH
jgi:hypothetical protein